MPSWTRRSRKERRSALRAFDASSNSMISLASPLMHLQRPLASDPAAKSSMAKTHLEWRGPILPFPKHHTDRLKRSYQPRSNTRAKCTSSDFKVLLSLLNASNSANLYGSCCDEDRVLRERSLVLQAP